jgi:iron-sulfur cluster assembly 1
MSLQRTLGPVTSSSIFFKALATASTSKSCPHTSRLLSTSRRQFQSSKRDLYTVPAYRPHSLPDPFPPPPRNTGIPDTSIAGPKPELNDTRPPKIPQPESLQAQISDETASISLPESEAQRSRPVQQPRPSISASTDAKPQRKSKLKPRKAAITITPPALHHLRDLLEQPDPKMIRVGVKNRGCSGLAYHLEYVEKPSAFDEVVEQDGVKVLVDSKALFSIIGSEMDWQEDKLSTRFVFKNPNIKEQCGCGESFMV